MFALVTDVLCWSHRLALRVIVVSWFLSIETLLNRNEWSGFHFRPVTQVFLAVYFVSYFWKILCLLYLICNWQIFPKVSRADDNWFSVKKQLLDVVCGNSSCLFTAIYTNSWMKFSRKSCTVALWSCLSVDLYVHLSLHYYSLLWCLLSDFCRQHRSFRLSDALSIKSARSDSCFGSWVWIKL